MRIACVAFALSLGWTSAHGHGGGLDAQGCHTNRKTGDYHCHRAPSTSTPGGALAPEDRKRVPREAGVRRRRANRPATLARAVAPTRSRRVAARTTAGAEAKLDSRCPRQPEVNSAGRELSLPNGDLAVRESLRGQSGGTGTGARGTWRSSSDAGPAQVASRAFDPALPKTGCHTRTKTIASPLRSLSNRNIAVDAVSVQY